MKWLQANCIIFVPTKISDGAKVMFCINGSLFEVYHVISPFIWNMRTLLARVLYNHLSILCRKVKVICLIFVSTFNVNHSVHSSLYIIITLPAHYNPHLIFLWRSGDFNSRLLRTVKGRNLILRLFLQMVQLTVKWGKTLNWEPPSGCLIACMRQSVSS